MLFLFFMFVFFYLLPVAINIACKVYFVKYNVSFYVSDDLFFTFVPMANISQAAIRLVILVESLKFDFKLSEQYNRFILYLAGMKEVSETSTEDVKVSTTAVAEEKKTVKRKTK